VLRERHDHKIVRDPLKDGFWKMFGKVIHSILESHHRKGDMIEARLGIIIGGAYVHGQADRYSPADGNVLQDYKVTKASSMLFGDKEEHHAQLNVLRYIWELHGNPVSKLENIYIFRDWEARQVKEGSLYPTEQVCTVNVPIWTNEKVKEYLLARVKAHSGASDLPDDDLPFCTDAERWMSLPEYKVYKFDTDKAGNVVRQTNAKYRSGSKLDCKTWMEDEQNAFPRIKVKGKNTEDPDTSKPFTLSLEEIKAKPTKCLFCDYRGVCNQRQAELASQGQETEEEDAE
jgi:hypothetical protein